MAIIRYLHLGLTAACNLNCKHCFIKEKESKELSFEKAIAFIYIIWMIAGRILVRKLIRLSKCSREENYPNTIGYLRFYRVFFIWMMMCLVRNYPAIRVVQK